MCMLDKFHARLNKASERLQKELPGGDRIFEFQMHRGQPTVSSQLAEYTVHIDMTETENLADNEIYDLLVSRHMDSLICSLNALEALQIT